MVGQRGMPAHDSRPLGVGSSPIDRKTRGRVTRSTTRSSVGESARPGSPSSALARARTSTSRASSSRSTTNAMKREVGSDTATTLADVSRKVRSASSSASRRGARAAAGRAERCAGYGQVAPTGQIAYQIPLAAGRNRLSSQVGRQERERLDDASRGRFGDGQSVAGPTLGSGRRSVRGSSARGRAKPARSPRARGGAAR